MTSIAKSGPPAFLSLKGGALPVYLQGMLSDQYLKAHVADLEREIANARLVAQATRDRRSLRSRLADRLYALAALVEGVAAAAGPTPAVDFQ
jgi:hypothetical protein